MRCLILHKSRERLRVHISDARMTARRAEELDAYLGKLSQVRSVRVYVHTGDAVIFHTGDQKAVLDALTRFRFGEEPVKADSVAVPAHSHGETGNAPAIRRRYVNKLIWKILPPVRFR